MMIHNRHTMVRYMSSGMDKGHRTLLREALLMLPMPQLQGLYRRYKELTVGEIRPKRGYRANEGPRLPHRKFTLDPFEKPRVK